MADRNSASDTFNIAMHGDPPRRSLRIMNQLHNSPAIRSTLKRTEENVAASKPKQSIVVEGNNTTYGGTDHSASSSAIGKQLRSPEACSQTEDELRKILDIFGPRVVSNHLRSGRELSALVHAHEKNQISKFKYSRSRGPDKLHR